MLGRTFCVVSCGEIIAQAPAFDANRAVKMITFGTFVNAVLVHHWYKLLWRAFPTPSVRHTVMKVAADQIFLAPIGIAGAIAYTSWVTGRDVGVGLQSKFLNMWLADWCVWPAASYINFRFVPRHRQPLVYAVVSVGWFSYVSRYAHYD